MTSQMHVYSRRTGKIITKRVVEDVEATGLRCVKVSLLTQDSVHGMEVNGKAFPVHAMKAYREMRYTSTHFDTRWR